MIPILIIDSEIEYRIDILDDEFKLSVPRGRDCLVLSVSLNPGVVQLHHHVRVALATEVGGVKAFGTEDLEKNFKI